MDEGKQPEPNSGTHLRQLFVPSFVAVAIILIAWNVKSGYEEQARESTHQLTNSVFGLSNPTENRLSAPYKDENGDGVADAPTDQSEWLTPEKLVFSYVASPEAADGGDDWSSLIDALSEATGLPVEHVPSTDLREQLRSLKAGELHIAGLNTGAVPVAVNACGFVPVSTLAHADGAYGYTMRFIVPAASPLQKLDDLKAPRAEGDQMVQITFTDRNSNSGFKAPVVLLADEFTLLPGIDYDFGFSTSHEESIRRVAMGEIQVAPVATDMIERTLAGDESIDPEAFRSIYESKPFPPAALGYVNRLAPDIAEKVTGVLTTYTFIGTNLEESFAASGVVGLAPVDYARDWEVIRRIDDAQGVVHEVE